MFSLCIRIHRKPLLYIHPYIRRTLERYIYGYHLIRPILVPAFRICTLCAK